MRLLSLLLRTLLPLLILGGCAWLTWWLLENPPEQPRMSVPASLLRVEGTRLKKAEYELWVKSQGTVMPRTTSTLLPEVSGKIIELSPAFRPGGFFSKDELLMKLDPTDYETAIVIAQAEVAQMEVLVSEEKARAEQALENWRALGRTGTPSALVTRAPQVAQAQANQAAAQARLRKAQRDLERTSIRAPYSGQVLEQNVDVGQFVNQGSTLGRVFAVDYVEVRLPIPEGQSKFIQLPQPFRDAASTEGTRVRFRAVGKDSTPAWEGRLVRVESSLDAQTRQLTAVAQVTDPYAKQADGRPPLTIGSFVEAEIAGQPLKDVYIIPRQAVRAGNEVILITTPANTLKRLIVEPLLSTEKHLIVSAKGDKAPPQDAVLCLTPIPFPADGAHVLPTIDGETPAPPVTQRGAPASKEEKPKKTPIVSQKADT